MLGGEPGVSLSVGNAPDGNNKEELANVSQVNRGQIDVTMLKLTDKLLSELPHLKYFISLSM